jgi:DNA-binding NarL/FixJ family response regulator
VFLDTDLQELSYAETIQRICESAPKAKVIMLTHSEREQGVYHAVKGGAKGYVSKDTGIEELVKILFIVARGEVVLSSVAAAEVLEEFTEFYPQWQHTH